MRWLPLACIALAVALAACQEPLSSDPLIRGRQLYARLDCATCHTIEGNGGRLGPELTHIATVAATRTPGQSAAEYIRRSVEDPGAYVVPGYNDVMPRGLVRRLTPEDTDALIAWLLTHD